MQHQQPSQSDLLKLVTGLENVHFQLTAPASTRKLLSTLFGEARHVDGEWTEFNVAGLDVAVTSGDKSKFVLTLKVERLEEVARLLIGKNLNHSGIQHGEHGKFLEVPLHEGICLHFFEPKKDCDSKL